MTHDASDGGDDDDAPPPTDLGVLDGDPHVTGTLFEAMANQRARYVLSYLGSVSVDVLDLEDVADGVAEREVEAGAATDVEDCLHHVTVALHHNHLPKLDHAGIIDYDPRSKTVRKWGDDRIETCLELFEAAKRS